ncbi:jg10079 [Pararge aegeria aegeria]|uniref:Jg10079 protein n=1 Tax=Pararge aegeria aegeria TaxID=348720 RepID=A0A8S4SI85_9NEOP|nr:jg10079 [Pararge aegeria aegeria]
MMRRGSMAIVGGGEPLIVVEESGVEDSETSYHAPVPIRGYSEDQESPPDPYHLSPWRGGETRKHSLPTPACTSGPTASQVRRLSERGEGAAREAREAAFLATLSQASPQPGGRRHSVVTISRVPQALFGRGRRESIAAFPALGRRRDSAASIKKCPPATDTLGSTHNLQLDIMDDIVQARKVRMRLWNTSNEKVCEVQPLDERSPSTSSVRYTNRGRRHSDYVGAPLPPIPARRRASEMPPPIPPRSGAGVVCTDTDLKLMLNALTSSATEIDRCGKPEQKRRLAEMRSSSFDASALREKLTESGATWFTRRHQTLETKKKENEPRKPRVTFAPDSKPASGDTAAVVWDRPTGSVVDASALGSAIEVFLRSGNTANTGPSTSGAKIAKETIAKTESEIQPKPSTSRAGRREDERWVVNRSEEEESAEGCDASLCSSLKDLFA